MRARAAAGILNSGRIAGGKPVPTFPRSALGLAFAAWMAAAAPAFAWDIYSYPEAKFAAQFPAEPQVAQARYRTTTGMELLYRS